MVRHSPTYFTGHIYICYRSDLVIAHLSLICPLRVSSKDNDCIDQRRPQWVVLFRQGWERTRGRKKRAKDSGGQNGMPSVATRLIALANQISILAVAFLLHTDYQNLICCPVFIARHISVLSFLHHPSLLLKSIIFNSHFSDVWLKYRHVSTFFDKGDSLRPTGEVVLETNSSAL